MLSLRKNAPHLLAHFEDRYQSLLVLLGLKGDARHFRISRRCRKFGVYVRGEEVLKHVLKLKGRLLVLLASLND
jgi:hypothetical protein